MPEFEIKMLPIWSYKDIWDSSQRKKCQRILPALGYTDIVEAFKQRLYVEIISILTLRFFKDDRKLKYNIYENLNNIKKKNTADRCNILC